MSQAGGNSAGGGGTFASSFVEDVGSATPAAGVINILGGVGISTSGSGNTVTITNTQDLTGYVPYVGATTDVVLGANDLSAENLTVTNGNLNLPAAGTWVVGTTGFINLNSERWIYEYGAFGNTALGLAAGNPAATTSNSNVAVGDSTMTGHGNGALRNTAVGAYSQQSLANGSDNTSLGQTSLNANQNGFNNVALGSYAMNAINGAQNCTVIGYNALPQGGSYDVVIGTSAGTGYSNGGNESSNILIANAGVAADQNTMRLGTQGNGNGQINLTYIAGIVGVTTSNSQLVTIDSTTGQLGVTTIPTAFTWQVVTSASNPVTLTASNGYITKGGTAVNFVLPAGAAVGDIFRIIGYGNLWTIAQNAGQSIRLGSALSTPGVGGSVTASMVTDCLDIICVTANLEFFCDTIQGNPIVV